MKKFLSQNWYRLMIASSLLIASIGFLIYSSNRAIAEPFGGNQDVFVVANNSGIYAVQQRYLFNVPNAFQVIKIR